MDELAQAEKDFKTAEQAHLEALRAVDRLALLQSQQQALATRQVACQTQTQRIEKELSRWVLFAKCMGADGLIALAIDDAGPALSALANDLLKACDGGRFTVSIHTLMENQKKERKEGFDIVVHDAESGQSQSVTLMSGGEKVLIEACLTRAIALYLAQNSGRNYSTLFSDEADGPLDIDRKRIFMAMKREVLRLGGYEREFYISQTPELTAMADAVIDMDVLRQELDCLPA
jgi:DNA repair protein SbcC/Rad50